ncbi:MAG: J domain-containing protein [Deltaproteobacteria bacterium]|nr:J domain-containing protein [Deltaproteobacteria bacterium]
MKTVDYYKILGISHSASNEEIKSAFRTNVSEYHPDKVEHLGEELKKYARMRLVLLNEARDILLDESTRIIYDRKLQEMKARYLDIQCSQCLEINSIPKKISRKGILKCRACGSDLGFLSNRNDDSSTVEWLLSSTLLTLRNISSLDLARIGLIVRSLNVEIEIKPEENSNSGNPNLIFITNNKKLYSGLIEGKSDSEWDSKFNVGWITVPGGHDRELSVRIVEVLKSIAPGGRITLSIEKSVEREKWAHWTSIFILCSLFPMAPWQANDFLKRFNGDLLQCSRGFTPSKTWLENLKINWKIFLGAPQVSRESNVLNPGDSVSDLKSIQIQLGKIIRKLDGK